MSAAFARGELSYSKVRALTRVATESNEAALLNIALHGTAAHMERLVRHYRQVERIEAAKLAETTHRECSVHYHYDESGALVIQARLPAEIGAVVLKALEAAEATLVQAERAEAGVDEEVAPPERTRSEAPPALHNDASTETGAAAARGRSTRGPPWRWTR